MTEDMDNTTGGAYEGKGLKGALWTIAGVAIGGLAARVLLPPGGAPFLGGSSAGVNALARENVELRVQLAETRAQAYTDRAVAPQLAVNAAQQAQLGFAAQQIGQLYSLTQLMVPNRNVAPGWGPASVAPAGLVEAKAATQDANG